MGAVYTIKDITHSGRKDIRGKQVTDVKYNGLIGLRVGFDINNIKQYNSVRLYLVDYHELYTWWDTSEVISLSVGGDGKFVVLETANTIYMFEKWEEEGE